MPAPTHVGIALGALIVELEASIPGITRRALERLEKDSSQASVIRIRGPSLDAETRAALSLAGRWMAVVSMFADATHGPVTGKRWKRR